MGKITGISLEYYTGELNIVELYRNFNKYNKFSLLRKYYST